jgi:choline-sulfatase
MAETETTGKNILLILCDQLSAAALSAYGNTYSRTPNINSISDQAAVFESAYTACPLCQPSRAAFWTSRYPHETNVRTNVKKLAFPHLSDDIPTLGEVFARNHYRCIHFGKQHDYGALRGFEVSEESMEETERTNSAIPFDYETFMDISTTGKVVRYLGGTAKQDLPFLLVADLQNPHNICEYIGEHENGVGDFRTERPLPELPANFAFTDIQNRPGVIQYLCCANRRQRQTSGWDETDFRYYLYAYYYYLEIVDRQIGEILNALKENKLDRNTLVVFFADHGEGMAAHELVTKYAAFYEETNHVPLFFTGPGVKAGRITGVASLLDLMPTLIDYAGLPERDSVLPSLRGVSLKKEILGERDHTEHSFVVSEWHDEFEGYTVPGRMICDGSFKYARYIGEAVEELYDLKKDPLETENLALSPACSGTLEKYRACLKEHVRESGDDFFQLTCSFNGSYRNHPPGRKYHCGKSAVEVYHEERKKTETRV